MKQAAPAIAAAALWGWFASCGGGVLSGNPGGGGNGMVGPVNPTGGATGSPTSTGGRDAGGDLPGFGGDIGPGPVGGSGGLPGRGGSGPAGRGGVGGLPGRGGGPGGEFGTGGTWVPPTCLSPAPPVCGPVCGNGRIDTCVRAAGPGCTAMTWAEACDSLDFGLDSCKARGYGSGSLSCNGDCTLGADTCSPCVVQSGLVAACGKGPPMSTYFGPHSMAATDSEVALLVIQYDANGTQSLLFERLSSDLKVLGTTALPIAGQGGSSGSIVQGTALAPLPSGGWTIAVCGEPDIYFQTLDAAGQERGRVVVSRSVDQYTFCSAGVPVLAARPDGGPLMIWRTETGVSMARIAPDGLSAGATQTIGAGDVSLSWDNVAAAWLGNEFAVAVPIAIDPYTRALRVLSVGADGVPRLVDDVLVGEVDAFISMANGPDASDLRVVYNGVPPGGDFNTDYGLVWWRPDAVAPARTALVGPAPDFFGPAPAVAFLDDTVVLAVRAYGDGQGVVRVASDGRIVSPYREIIRTPPGYGGPAAMVRRGPEIVVSFVSFGRMYLARLTP